jgi:small subunit ribosomal protein S4
MVYRMGFAPSRKAARQLIRHRHIEINGKRVDVPSFAVAPGQEIKMRAASRELAIVITSLEQAGRGSTPSWLAVDKDSFSGRMLERPQRSGIPVAAQEQLVVELYSK